MSKNRALCHSLLCEFEHPSVKSKAKYFLFNFKSKNICDLRHLAACLKSE